MHTSASKLLSNGGVWPNTSGKGEMALGCTLRGGVLLGLQGGGDGAIPGGVSINIDCSKSTAAGGGLSNHSWGFTSGMTYGGLTGGVFGLGTIRSTSSGVFHVVNRGGDRAGVRGDTG